MSNRNIYNENSIKHEKAVGREIESNLPYSLEHIAKKRHLKIS